LNLFLNKTYKSEIFKYADVGTYPTAIERKHHLQLENILSDPKSIEAQLIRKNKIESGNYLLIYIY